MPEKFKILIVEDELNILNFLTTVLSSNGYGILRARNGREALLMLSSNSPNVMLLDLGLPDMDGLDIIRQVRTWTQIPIIVVSARTLENEKVQALDAGADDYLTKPFGTSELLARIRASLRHAGRSDGDNSARPVTAFRANGLVVDFIRRRVTVDDQEVRLTQTEFNIVSLLANYHGRVLTYDSMIRAVWGPAAVGDDTQILRVNLANIRRKIERNPGEPQYILTEIGVGYRMIEGETTT